MNIPIEVCPSSNLSVVPAAHGMVKAMPHLAELMRLNHNIVICCDDTMLFSTNHSSEVFEFANSFGLDTAFLKSLLMRNVDAIFDESSKAWLRQEIESYRI